MAINSVSRGDDLIRFLGKMPAEIGEKRFSYKKRIVYSLLDDLESSGVLEIVPGSFSRREPDNVHFLSRHNKGIYLEYSGKSEAGFGLGDFYRESLGYWIPQNSILKEIPDKVKKEILDSFQKKVRNSGYVLSGQELINFNYLRAIYFEAMDARDIVSG